MTTVAAAGVPPVRVGALQALADRQVTNAAPVLLQSAKDNNLEVARSAFEALAVVGTPDIYGRLVRLLAKANTSTEQAAASRAVVSVGTRVAEPGVRRRALVEALPGAEGYGKAGLIDLLAAEGGLEAMRAVREGLADPHPAVKAQALFSLTRWSDPSAAEDLYRLAQGERRGGVQTAALRGYLNTATHTPTNRIEMLRQARMIVAADAEKKLLLAALAEMDETGALELATGLLADLEVQVEAEVAVLKLADRLADKDPVAVQTAIARLLLGAKDPATIRQAEAVLQKSKTALDAPVAPQR